MKNSALRRLERVVGGRRVSEGGGVNLLRLIGGGELDMLDPFLLLDEFRSDRSEDYMAGFPSHPHRGFETVTYMMAGSMLHEDSGGGRGVIEAGGAQWMTAGRGIIHSEMPRQERGLMWGFQLWVNLPSSEKMREPRYRNIAPESIPRVSDGNGAAVKVIAGSVAGVAGPVRGIVTDPLYLDVSLMEGAEFRQPVAAGHTAFLYIYEGEACIGEGRVGRGNLAVLSDGDSLSVSASVAKAGFLLVAARPLNEPVARYGPFVMNTEEEIRNALEDYREGRLVASASQAVPPTKRDP